MQTGTRNTTRISFFFQSGGGMRSTEASNTNKSDPGDLSCLSVIRASTSLRCCSEKRYGKTLNLLLLQQPSPGSAQRCASRGPEACKLQHCQCSYPTRYGEALDCLPQGIWVWGWPRWTRPRCLWPRCSLVVTLGKCFLPGQEPFPLPL